MPIRRQKLPGIVTYFVVDREESTQELVYSRGFTTMKEAELFKMEYAERPTPQGRTAEVTIEVLLTGTLPEKSKPKR
jgi:hypothetical protein